MILKQTSHGCTLITVSGSPEPTSFCGAVFIGARGSVSTFASVRGLVSHLESITNDKPDPRGDAYHAACSEFLTRMRGPADCPSGSCTEYDSDGFCVNLDECRGAK